MQKLRYKKATNSRLGKTELFVFGHILQHNRWANVLAFKLTPTDDL